MNVATNLFTLFAKVTENYSYSQVELELWQDFMNKMNSRLHFNFPKIVSGSPSPEAPPLSSLLGRGMTSERALVGCNFLLIDVADVAPLRALILQHGGAIYEYAAKSVCLPPAWLQGSVVADLYTGDTPRSRSARAYTKDFGESQGCSREGHSYCQGGVRF